MKKLSNREVEIIKYIANGCTAKEIARVVGLEPRTIETYLFKVRKKLCAKNIAHAIYIACNKKLFEP